MANISIQEIKQKYEMEWMKLTGVEGVGISEEDSQPVIIVYISNSAEELTKKIPSQVEGYPVILKYVGEIKAF